MNKLTKGALSMVLAGFVTFSVTNSLLVNQSPNQAAEKIPADDNKKADETKEKTLKTRTPIAKVNPEPTKPTPKNPAVQVAFNNNEENDRVIAVIQSSTHNSSGKTSTSPAHVNTSTSPANVNTTTTATQAVTTIPVTSAPSTATTPTTISTSSGSNTTSTTTSKTNNGQKVSQAAKDKAESRQVTREINGKKK